MASREDARASLSSPVWGKCCCFQTAGMMHAELGNFHQPGLPVASPFPNENKMSQNSAAVHVNGVASVRAETDKLANRTKLAFAECHAFAGE